METYRRLQRSARNKGWFLSHRDILWSVTAVVLLMEVGPELLTVVAATPQVPPAALVTVVGPAVQGAVTVTLAQTTGLFGSAATSPIVVPPTAPLT